MFLIGLLGSSCICIEAQIQAQVEAVRLTEQLNTANETFNHIVVSLCSFRIKIRNPAI